MIWECGGVGVICEIPTITVLVCEDCVVGVVHVFVCVLPAGFHVLREEQQQQQ